jgi:hypothetical protein
MLRVFCFSQPLKCTYICTFFLETLLTYSAIIQIVRADKCQ